MEKKYLKNWQKIAYGSGDFGSNFMFTFVASFVLIYLTDTIGLNAGIIGTLMMVSKCLDGVTDVFFGSLIDRTRSKMGKARPWLFWSTFLLAAAEILLFMVPGTNQTMQYVYFFIVYTLLNACFYTANNIAYASLTALMTKNPNERVQVGSIRFMFALAAGMTISSATMALVNGFGGGTAGWRAVAVIYSLVMIAFNMICVFSVKELPEEDKEEIKNVPKASMLHNMKLLLHNKYYLLILAYYIVNYLVQGIGTGVGIYFCTYVLGNAAILGIFSMASMVPMILGLIITPFLVKKLGIYKVNLYGVCFSVIFSVPLVIAGFMGNIPLLLLFMVLKGFGMSPMLGTINAVIADAAAYTYHKDKVHLDGTMYSCSSMGMKVGSGIGSAVCGWLLAFAGYNGLAAVQPDSVINMIKFMYLGIPLVSAVLLVIIAASLNVQKANKQFEEAKKR